MRLWSIHPKYLDSKGLVALWREGLLAQKVLAGKTKGYHHHPQLERFKKTKDPLSFIGTYLYYVLEEAKKRNYNFNHLKIIKTKHRIKSIRVTSEQLKYEAQHLKSKLKKRSPCTLKMWGKVKHFSPHPLFKTIQGGIHTWEKQD